jgi:hypothetical protein
MTHSKHAIRLSSLLVLLACASISACHRPTNIVTPQGKAAYDADQVVLRLQELSNVVKADTGTQPGNIRPADAFTIIEWISGDANHRDGAGAIVPTVGVVQLIQATASQGWKAAARLSWTARVKPILLLYPKLAPWADVVDGLLQEVL